MRSWVLLLCDPPLAESVVSSGDSRQSNGAFAGHWARWLSSDTSSAEQLTAQTQRRRHIGTVSFDLKSCAKTQLQQSLTPLAPLKTTYFLPKK